MKLQDLFNAYANLNNQERFEAGRKAFERLGVALSKLGYSAEEIASLACSLVRLAAGADKYGSEEEFNLFVKVTGIELDKFEFYAMVKHANSEGYVAPMDQIVDALNPEAKAAALDFVAFFFSADHELSEAEKALFKRLED